MPIATASDTRPGQGQSAHGRHRCQSRCRALLDPGRCHRNLSNERIQLIDITAASADIVDAKLASKAVARQRVRMLRTQRTGRSREGLREIVVHVAAEVGRVVGIDGSGKPRVEQFAQVVTGEIRERRRASGSTAGTPSSAMRSVRQPLHQRQPSFARLHAMVDTLDLEQVKRRPHIGWRAFFTRVRHQPESPVRGSVRKHARKFFRRGCRSRRSRGRCR